MPRPQSTWKDEDEEGTDSPDDTDDLTDVGYEHSDQKCNYDPEHRQQVAAPPFQLC